MNKSSKKFTIISGIYIFLLTFLLLTQPRSGYTATVEQVLSYYALYLPLWVFIAVTVFVATKNTNKSWYEFVFGKKAIFWSLILLIVVGFILNLDYQRQSGCFVEDELMFSPTKFILSIGSILLLSSGYYYSDTKLGSSLLIAEFIFWTFKVLYYNGSLDVPYPGYFTMICWTLRFVLIVKILNRHTVDAIKLDTKTNR